MFFNKAISILSPSEARNRYPFPSEMREEHRQVVQTCRSIIEKKEKKIAIFLGPCSIHEEESALEFARRIRLLQEKTKHHFLLVMRIFVEKSRSKFGWRGFLHDPKLDESYCLEEGIARTRVLFSSLVEMGVPLSSELLDPLLVPYYHDFLSWGFIGARTSSSPIHRQMASSYYFPIGFKNSLQGEVDVALSGALVARKKSIFPGIDEQGKISKIIASGNPFAHLVLRGSKESANYYPKDVETTIMMQQKESFSNGIVIDCAHGNAKKQPHLQKIALHSILEQMTHGNVWIRGLMLESFLHSGSQEVKQGKSLQFGQSITDPCLGWKETEELILQAHEKVSETTSTF